MGGAASSTGGLCPGKQMFTYVLGPGRPRPFERVVHSRLTGAMTRGQPTTVRCRGSLPAWAGTLVCAWVALAPLGAEGQSLRGGRASVERQNRAARQHDYTFIDTGDRVRYFASQGWLVRIRPTRDFTLHAVSYPYARPEVQLFLTRLGAQYRAACGEQLVATSLTRPATRQPRNASDRSVHPTGMAIDLRYSRKRNCRRWLEGVLLDLERLGKLAGQRRV